MNTIADRIKLLRGALSRRAFSSELDIQESTLRNYEAGSSLPNFDLLQNICKKMRVNPAWLLLGEGAVRTDDTPHTPERPPLQDIRPAGQCLRCARMEEKIERLEDERRELNTENRELWKKNEQLNRENGELREACAILKERQKPDCSGPPFGTPQPSAPSSKQPLT